MLVSKEDLLNEFKDNKDIQEFIKTNKDLNYEYHSCTSMEELKEYVIHMFNGTWDDA
eukprot:SAG11_NODE_8064_length_1063_cov_105.607884_2_plen_57_part_00